MNKINKKTIKLKDLPEGIDDLINITDKPIKLRKTVKLKSDKNINADIDKLLKEVDTIVRKQKKGALTMTQVRSEIFNKLLKEADKQHDNEEITDGEYVLIVRNLNNGNFKTAENLLMGKKQIAEFEKLVKSIPKPIKTKKQKKTKAMLAEEREPHDDEYLMSLPKTKKGLISRSSKEFKALTAEEKERAFSLSELSRTEAKKTKQVEAKAKLSARNKADKQSGQLNIVKTKTLEEAKAEIEAKKKALEEKKKTEASKPSVAKEAEARLKTDLLDFDKAVKRLPEISSISDLSDTVKHRFLNLLSDAYANKKSVSETIKLLRGNKTLSEERIIELMDIYDAKENIDLLNKYKNLI